MWFRLLEHFANHTGNILVPWCDDKAMGGCFGGIERKGEKRDMILKGEKKSLLREASVSRVG